MDYATEILLGIWTRLHIEIVIHILLNLDYYSVSIICFGKITSDNDTQIVMESYNTRITQLIANNAYLITMIFPF